MRFIGPANILDGARGSRNRRGIDETRHARTAPTALQRQRDARPLLDRSLRVELDGKRLAGVVSERDYARKVALRDRSSRDTLVRDIMTTDVVTVTPKHTVPQCIALMSARGIRHLPIVDGGQVVGVLSARDLLKAVVEHHERCIRELELDRMTMLNPNVSSY